MSDAHPLSVALASFGLAIVTPGGAPASPAAPEMHSYVTVAGVSYLVATRGERVRVTAAPPPASRSPEARDGMRQAVVEATGCRIVEDRWSGAALLGELDCRERLPRKDR